MVGVAALGACVILDIRQQGCCTPVPNPGNIITILKDKYLIWLTVHECTIN